jgi:hypothetical protein
MMNDDTEKFDEIIRSAAQDYNRPPNIVPRDEMWAAIEAAQADRARRPLHIVPASPRPSFTRWTWIGVAAAAVLLIATGVGIGRWSNSPSASQKTKQMATETQKQGTVITGGEAIEAGKQPETAAPRNPTQVAENGSQGAGRRAPAAERGARGAERGVRGVERGVPGAGRGLRVAGTGNAPHGTGNGEPFTGNSALSYQVATVRHLSNAEALLTAFKNDNKDAALDASLSIWARDLLSNTRLLIDSPAAEDPQRRKLLGDLELVLAEIVQLSPGASAQDRDLVAGSIKNGNVMTRLRSAIPAGQTRGL